MDEKLYLESARAARVIILESIFRAKKGHIGGALSIVDFLVFAYGLKLVEPHPGGNKTVVDKPLVFSKAHSSTALLATMQVLFPDRALSLDNYNLHGSLAGNNPCEQVFGVEMHGGSLGHGLSYAAGICFGATLEGKTKRVVAVLSEGDLMEGSTWEALMFIAHFNLDVCVVVDLNGQLCEGFVSDILSLGELHKKFRAFGLECTSVNGHEFNSLLSAEDIICNSSQPRAIILETVKGKGVSFMESKIKFHHSIPNDEEYRAAKAELEISQ